MSSYSHNVCALRCGNTSHKIDQLVAQHCCVEGCRAMLLDLPPHHNLARKKICLLQVAKICCRKQKALLLFATKLLVLPLLLQFAAIFVAMTNWPIRRPDLTRSLQLVAKQILLRCCDWVVNRATSFNNLQRNNVVRQVGLFCCS